MKSGAAVVASLGAKWPPIVRQSIECAFDRIKDRAVLDAAFDALHGEKWTYSTGGYVVSSPTLSPDGGTIYVGSSDDKLHAVYTGACAARFFLSGAVDCVACTPVDHAAPDATFTCTTATYLGPAYPGGMFGAVDSGQETAVRQSGHFSLVLIPRDTVL